MTEKAIATTTQAGPISPFASIDGFEAAQRMAKALAASSFIPKEFRGNIGDCLIVIETAARTNMPLMAIMQNIYVVHGKPSFSSAFMAGMINNSGRFDGPLQFRYSDDGTECYAYAVKNGEEYKGPVVSMDMAKAEGWLDKKGSKWKTMPRIMLQYRAISFFSRAYCADLIMGMRSADEVADAGATPVEVSEGLSGVTGDLNERFGGEVIDASTGEVKQKGDGADKPKKKPATRKKSAAKKPATKQADKNDDKKAEPSPLDQLKAEIDEIKSGIHLDRWRLKHVKRIERMLGDEKMISELHAYADAHAKKLKAAREDKIEIIDCPAGKGNVPTEYCNGECKSRGGCPAWQ